MTRSAAVNVRGADDWVERVRAASDIVEIVSQSVALKRVGRNWVGLCPFHQERTPSFSVHAERQFYHCFSCKAGGDVFRFVQETEKLGFVEAVEWLSRRAGIPVPEKRPGERSRRTLLLEALEAAATACEQWLGDPQRGAEVRRYLAGRGVLPDTVRTFRLGLVPAGWTNLADRLRPRFDDDVLVEAGLAARRDGGRGGVYDRFRNRLMVPLVAPGGAVVGFGARALDADDTPKYLNSPETPVYHKGSFLFGYEQARRHLDAAGEVVLVEGYFDVVALHQAGVGHTVASSGTALGPEQAKILKRVVARVALTYDGDAAGQEAMMRSLGVLLAEGLDVVVVDLPRGQDPDTLVRAGGAEAWHAARAAAADPVEFIQRHVLRAGDPGDPRERAAQALVGLASAVADPIRLELLLERGTQVFGLARGVLARAVALRRKGFKSEAVVSAGARQATSAASHPERQLLASLLRAPEALDEARARLVPDDFRDPACAALARALWVDVAPEGEAAALERELLAGGDDDTDWALDAAGWVRRLARRQLEHEWKELQQRIVLLQRHGSDPDEELMRRSFTLRERIQELSKPAVAHGPGAWTP